MLIFGLSNPAMSTITPPTSSPTDPIGEGRLSDSLGSLSLAAGAQDADDEAFEHANKIISGYLKANVPIFARLCDLRQRVTFLPHKLHPTPKNES